jgi:hypothetical protein
VLQIGLVFHKRPWEIRRDALSVTADTTFLVVSAKFVMDVGCRNGAHRGGDDHLIEPANNIPCRIESGNRCFLMRIDLQGTVLITVCKKRARKIVLRAAA